MTKFIDPTLTIMIQDADLVLEVSEGGTRVLTVTLRHSEFVRALGRLSDVACSTASLLRPEIAGCLPEHQDLEFPIPDGTPYDARVQTARHAAECLCPSGWVPDRYYGSRDSFFTRDGKPWARTIIRRWVKPTE